MAKKKFKTESKRILDLMVNSIYTNREIFLRELISNASDAIDKLYFKRLSAEGAGLSRSEYGIHLSFDKESRTLTLSDNGIGMDERELENNLGTIAKSGSLDFKNENDADDLEIIGQFGVGFYSAFMVAKRVEVVSRAYGANEAFRWASDGSDGYTIEPCEKETVGTEITLWLKDDSEQESYSEFLDQYRLSEIVRRYSDYIRYPITMDMQRSRLKEGSDKEYETVTEAETLNSMVPIWRKNKDEASEEECFEFYKSKFFDFEDPLAVIRQKTEGTATFSAIMFIPSRAPYNFYTKSFEKGLQLYSSGVMITEHCSELLPDYLAFVRGIVDSEDLSLNISREMLQHDRQLKIIAAAVEKRILKELADMLSGDRERYERLFDAFGVSMKFGVYADYGMNKDKLCELLLFKSAKSDKYITLSEYVAQMAPDQKYIYYAAGDKNQNLKSLPAAETVLSRGYDLLLLTDDVDEFAVKILHEHKEREFRSIASGNLELSSEEDKTRAELAEKEHGELFSRMHELLGDRVSAVKASERLVSHPVCLSTKGEISIEMEKVLAAMPASEGVKAEKVLEINCSHPVFETLCALFDAGDERLEKYTRLLYNQALLIEGLPVEDAAQFSLDICELMK